MGWYSVFSDWRIKFLIISIVVAAAIATILTYVEARIRRKKEAFLEEEKRKFFIANVKKKVLSQEDVLSGLDVLDSVSKKYFRERFGLYGSYTDLVDEFEKKGKTIFADFCRAMFHAYYSPKELDRAELKAVVSKFFKGYLEEEGVREQLAKPKKGHEAENNGKSSSVRSSTFVGKISKKSNKSARHKKVIKGANSSKKKLNSSKERLKIKDSKETEKPKSKKAKKGRGIFDRIFGGRLSKEERLRLERKRWLDELKRRRKQQNFSAIVGGEDWLKKIHKEIRIK
ncbi:hypothetical protein D6829_00580 [Candidatus Pacearchaeota archaeon]|nr:MAG: hypothetical protein D6829_00580 [Candidatus Pacearchaeota archaeon]